MPPMRAASPYPAPSAGAVARRWTIALRGQWLSPLPHFERIVPDMPSCHFVAQQRLADLGVGEALPRFPVTSAINVSDQPFEIRLFLLYGGLKSRRGNVTNRNNV